MSDAMDPPYGAFSLPGWEDWLRRCVGRFPTNRLGRIGASLVRRFVTRRGSNAYDVEVFPTIHARLYPATNTCERRALTAAQHFDIKERSFLDGWVATSSSDPFVFLDLGANVGLYGLFVLASARRHGRTARILAVEPDKTTRARLLANVKFSNAEKAFIVEACGVGAARGTAVIAEHGNNRGEHRLVMNGEAASADETRQIEVVPLIEICARHAITSIDALKIDIEGMDYEVLAAFFEAAPAKLRPKTFIVEVGRDNARPDVVVLAEKYGYNVHERTRLNSIMVRDH